MKNGISGCTGKGSEKRDAIERIPAYNGEIKIVIPGGEPEKLETSGVFDYYLVTTDDFAGIAPKGSVLRVHVDRAGCNGTLDAHSEIGLVAADNRLELRPAAKCAGTQIIGNVCEIRRWPTMDINNPYC